MTLPAIFKPTATEEFETAIKWYEDEQAGLGGKFKEAVFAAIASIQQHPRTYPRIHRQLRRAKVKRFPYAVIYIIEPLAIRVIAIFHMHRNQEEWKSRVN